MRQTSKIFRNVIMIIIVLALFATLSGWRIGVDAFYKDLAVINGSSSLKILTASQVNKNKYIVAYQDDNNQAYYAIFDKVGPFYRPNLFNGTIFRQINSTVALVQTINNTSLNNSYYEDPQVIFDPLASRYSWIDLNDSSFSADVREIYEHGFLLDKATLPDHRVLIALGFDKEGLPIHTLNDFRSGLNRISFYRNPIRFTKGDIVLSDNSEVLNITPGSPETTISAEAATLLKNLQIKDEGISSWGTIYDENGKGSSNVETMSIAYYLNDDGTWTYIKKVNNFQDSKGAFEKVSSQYWRGSVLKNNMDAAIQEYIDQEQSNNKVVMIHNFKMNEKETIFPDFKNLNLNDYIIKQTSENVNFGDPKGHPVLTLEGKRNYFNMSDEFNPNLQLTLEVFEATTNTYTIRVSYDLIDIDSLDIKKETQMLAMDKDGYDRLVAFLLK